MDKNRYNQLHSIVFQSDYPGYRPSVKEIPNGDAKVDLDKRFAHIADKYLMEYPLSSKWATLYDELTLAHDLAVQVAMAMGTPDQFLPMQCFSNLRVLEYPAGAGSHEHTDFDLLTIMVYRDQPEHFHHDASTIPDAAKKLNAQVHIGEIGEL